MRRRRRGSTADTELQLKQKRMIGRQSSEPVPSPLRPHLQETERLGYREKAVLVSVEFTAQRRRLSPTAKSARSASELLDPTADILSADAPADHRTSPGPSPAVPDDGEFTELAESAGAIVVAKLHQSRPKSDPATLIGAGKLEEVEGAIASTGADLVLFDHELTPSQLRNLEARLPCRVLDRTQLILDIFARHARTREGQLQVELAQLEYQLPRLAGRGRSMSQLGGGIGTRGPGETQLETDRRKIRLRIDHIKEQLESVRRVRTQQRTRREAVPVPVVALVGYTNAGKSTLFNALTEAGVFESKRMFATLDPKLSRLRLPSRRKVLLSDTVGFIRNLPHTLVTSFRATLEEVQRADLLLHVQDAASPAVDEQRIQVEKVLSELEMSDKPMIEVLNKIDLLPGNVGESVRRSGSVGVSALRKQGLDQLLAAIDEALIADPLIEVSLRIPQSEGTVLAALEAGATLTNERYEGNLIFVTVVGPTSLLSRYRQFLNRSGSALG